MNVIGIAALEVDLLFFRQDQILWVYLCDTDNRNGRLYNTSVLIVCLLTRSTNCLRNQLNFTNFYCRRRIQGVWQRSFPTNDWKEEGKASKEQDPASNMDFIWKTRKFQRCQARCHSIHHGYFCIHNLLLSRDGAWISTSKQWDSYERSCTEKGPS